MEKFIAVTNMINFINNLTYWLTARSVSDLGVKRTIDFFSKIIWNSEERLVLLLELKKSFEAYLGW